MMRDAAYRNYPFLCVITLLFLLSCSSEKPADTAKQKPHDRGNVGTSETVQGSAPSPHSFSLEIVPSDATRKSVLQLAAQGFSLQDATIEWLVNGRPFTPLVPHQFNVSEVRRGDTIQARASMQGRDIMSNTVTIKNTPPELTRVKIMPEIFKPGDMLFVEAAASDVDGDEVSILYQWTKNGEPAGNSKEIGVQIRRGDKISIKITPFDGESHGRSITLDREIANMPPMIIESKRFSFDGSLYTYQVTATDPDGDTLTYSLKSAPQGMTIDPATGMIRWFVPADFKGRAPITVSVSDGHGGETTQSLSLDIKPEAKR